MMWYWARLAASASFAFDADLVALAQDLVDLVGRDDGLDEVVEGRVDDLRGEVGADPLVEVGRELAVDVVVHDAGELDRLVLGRRGVDLLELVRLDARVDDRDVLDDRDDDVKARLERARLHGAEVRDDADVAGRHFDERRGKAGHEDDGPDRNADDASEECAWGWCAPGRPGVARPSGSRIPIARLMPRTIAPASRMRRLIIAAGPPSD